MTVIFLAGAHNFMKIIKFIALVIAIGGPLSAIGLALYLPALHAGFYPVFLLVPSMVLDGRAVFGSISIYVWFTTLQFIYYAVLVGSWQLWRSRRALQ